MTIIAIWEEEGVLWAAADSRVSNPERGGVQILSDAASKIFALPVVCRPIGNSDNLFPEPNQRYEFGFAFAGSTLPAVMTFATASTLASHLGSMAYHPTPPRLLDIVRMVGHLLNRYCREMSSAQNHAIQCEAAVFGYCPADRANRAYRLRYDPAAESIVPELYNTAADVLKLGGGTERFSQIYAELLASGDEYLRTTRLPKIAVSQMVEEGKGGVGGGLSLAIATSTGLSLFSSVEPVEKGEPLAKVVFNGIDLDEIGFVGEYAIMMPGIA